MANGKITKRTIDSLVSQGYIGFVWDLDTKGFGAKFTKSGAISYVVQYRMGGREAATRRYTIGRHGSPWTPTTARTEAERLLILVAQGRDPVEADKLRRREAVDLAFSNYADLFGNSVRGEGWTKMVKRSLRLHVKPILKNKPLPQITRSDIAAVLDAMPVSQIAKRRDVFAVIRRMFRWAVSRGDLERSPTEGMETPPPVTPRERWLADDELKRIWKHAPTADPCFGPIVRLLIVTGQRREEVSRIAWEELDRAEKLWTLPGTRAKNGKANTIPLKPATMSLGSLPISPPKSCLRAQGARPTGASPCYSRAVGRPPDRRALTSRDLLRPSPPRPRSRAQPPGMASLSLWGAGGHEGEKRMAR